MLFDMWIRQCWQIEQSVRSFLKTLTPGEMPPSSLTPCPWPHPCIFVSAPGICRPVTHLSKSTTERKDSRVTSQPTSFFTLFTCSKQSPRQPVIVMIPVNKFNKLVNNPISSSCQAPSPRTTVFSPEAMLGAKDKDITCTHARSLAVCVFSNCQK